jgi:hypothetical protein
MTDRPRTPLGPALLLVAVALGTTACVGPTPEEQTTTLQFAGGKFIRTAPEFLRCVSGGTKGPYDLGGKEFTYPADQRRVDFTGGDGADRGPIIVKSKDGLEMAVHGKMQYNLNTECGDGEGEDAASSPIVAFHQNIGRREAASFDEGPSEVPNGWRILQQQYVETPLERDLVSAAAEHNWFALWKDPLALDAVEKSVNGSIQASVDNDTPTDEEFYKNFRLSITRMEPAGERGEQVKNAIADGEKRAAEGRANEQAALANKAAAVAETAAEVERAKKLQAQIAGFGSVQEFNKHQCIVTPGCQPYVTVYGGSTVTTPGS